MAAFDAISILVTGAWSPNMGCGLPRPAASGFERSLSTAAARLPERRVRDDSTLPPEIFLLLGAGKARRYVRVA